MKKINIEILNKPTRYDILIGENLIHNLKTIIPHQLEYSKYIVIFDSNISSNAIDEIKILFNDAVYIPVNLTSNNKKSFREFLHIHEQLINQNIDKNSLILSLGGGSVGDLIAFVASTYNRGIDYINIPTTLLSMIDSSIGGKTGLDLKDGKNLIGTFYHPKAVIIDTNFLSTLSKEEITSGLFEAIKYGIACDFDLFLFIKENKNNLYDINILMKIIEWCCEIKTNIITKDEKDNNIRNKLNFGHTIGHAIESIYSIRHGEAVAYGMIGAAYLSKAKDTLDNSDLDEIVSLINHLDLPNIHFDTEKILDQLSKDKKRINGKNNFILLNSIGNSYISDNIEVDLIKNTVSNL